MRFLPSVSRASKHKINEQNVPKGVLFIDMPWPPYREPIFIMPHRKPCLPAFPTRHPPGLPECSPSKHILYVHSAIRALKK